MTTCLLVALALRPAWAPQIPAGWLEAHGAAGVAVAVARPEGLLTAEAGWADVEGNRPVGRTTTFRLGSISKSVTGALVMRQVRAGKLDLDRGISAYVSGFDDRGGSVTLRRVLSHTAGIRHYQPGRTDNSTTYRTTAQALTLFVKDPLRFAPGSDYGYSTHGYTLAAAALEKATGRGYAELVAREMGRTIPSLRAEDLRQRRPAHRSSLYRRANERKAVPTGPPEDNSWKFAGGGLEASASDLAAFGLRVLDDRWLAPGHRKEMWTAPPILSGRNTGYGLGWASGPDGTRRHSGSQQGCSSMLMVDPERKIAVAVLCNTFGVDRPVAELAEALLREARGR